MVSVSFPLALGGWHLPAYDFVDDLSDRLVLASTFFIEEISDVFVEFNCGFSSHDWCNLCFRAKHLQRYHHSAPSSGTYPTRALVCSRSRKRVRLSETP